MADGIFNKIADKTGHIFNQMGGIGLKGMRIGAGICAVVGIGVAIATVGWAAPLLLWGPVAGALGGITGALTGGTIGGALGTLKGMFTRVRPNGDKIIQEAVAKEGQQPAMPAMGQSLPTPELQPTMQLPQAGQVATPLPPATLADLQRMTAELNKVQAEAPVPVGVGQAAAPMPPAGATNWRERVSQPPLAAAGVGKV